nr:hypothetical protein [Arsukibacterium perlucidum]
MLYLFFSFLNVSAFGYFTGFFFGKVSGNGGGNLAVNAQLNIGLFAIMPVV